jgi:nucleoid-associated protein YgaU
MGNYVTPAETKRQLQAIRAAQLSVEQRIRAVRTQLKEMDQYPASQPWVSFERAQKVEDLRSKFPSLKEALKEDLRKLKTQLATLHSRTKNLEDSVARQRAGAVSRDFKKRLENTLKSAESHGELNERELETVRREADDVLIEFIQILGSNPSRTNVQAVLAEMSIPMLLGCSPDSGACAKAWESLANATKAIRLKSERDFRSNPTVSNFDRLIQAEALNQTVGGTSSTRPAGWREVHKVHLVRRGDSLSGLSQEYYGTPGYWDVIYMENYDVIGGDPNQLRVGVELVIP